jgi:uncharacterized protein with NAD-binding domain and iron-sulfur cluster
VGFDVTLLEARKSLGGRAGSFEDPQTGELLDNCQHVLLGCCTNLINFYHRIGAESLIQFHPQIHFRDERGRRHDLFGVQSLPAPLNLAPSLLDFSALSLPERWKLTEAMLHMGQTDRRDVEEMSFGEWLDAHDQPESLVRKFYDTIVISGLNEDTRRASAAYAIQIFQESLLANRGAYVMGMPASTLGELYSRLHRTPSPGTPGDGRGEGPARKDSHPSPLPEYRARGQESDLLNLRLSTRVISLRFDGQQITGVELHTGDVLSADAYVIATNHHALQKWIPPQIARGDERFANLDRFESVPILGVHLWFDRPILRESHAALMRGPLQWVFRKDVEGKAVHGVISAARSFVDRSKDQMLAEFERQVRETFALARDAKLIRGVIVIEKRATFSPTPRIDRIRPPQAPGPNGGIRNLYLAGDYTRTGWPATMEGAVRSGYLAAGAIAGRSFLVPDLPIEWPARFLGYRR